MNTQDERKAFEEAVKENFNDLVSLKLCLNSDGDYLNWDALVAWRIWQAAKAHEAKKLEGCVVVPVEPTEAMLIKGNRLALADKGYRYDAASIWEAMLEAARGGNE